MRGRLAASGDRRTRRRKKSESFLHHKVNFLSKQGPKALFVSVSSLGLEFAVEMGCMTHAATILLGRRTEDKQIGRYVFVP